MKICARFSGVSLSRITLDDVNRVLRTYYDENTATVAISTPKEAAGSAFGGRVGEDNTVIPTEHTGLPAFAKRVLAELRDGARRLRVGLRPEGRVPAREGAEIKANDGTPIGKVTSGGFGPSLGGPIAMGYVERAFAEPGTPVALVVRGKDIPASVAALPFVPHHYYRGT